MKDKHVYFLSSIISLAMFIIYTVMLKKVDVAAIGPKHSEVGFAAANKLVKSIMPYRPFWHDLTEKLGLVAIGIGCIFALVALVQLLKRKKFLKVDHRLLLLGGLYVALGIVYVLFEKVVINYRPVILDQAVGLEASYPSSHTLLTVVICATAPLQFEYLLKSDGLKGFLRFLCLLVSTVAVFGRVLSGVHWFTDIVGGLLLAAFLINIYIDCVALDAEIQSNRARERRRQKQAVKDQDNAV